MTELSTHLAKFTEMYTAQLGVVTENLAVLKQLLERDYLLKKDHADAYLRVCSILLIDACRMLGEATSQNCGCPGAASSHDLRDRRREPLFTASSRKLTPLECDELEDGCSLLRCPTEKALTHEQIQQIHDAAENVVFDGGREPRSDSEAAAAHSALREGYDQLANNLRNHVVDLSEWGLLCVVQFDELGDPYYSFVTPRSFTESI